MTLPRSTSNPQPSIELHINEFVLHGLPLTRSQGSVVRAAVESELVRLLTERGLRPSSAGTASPLSAGVIPLTEDSGPAHLGQQIAQAVYGHLTPTPVSSHQTHAIKGAS